MTGIVFELELSDGSFTRKMLRAGQTVEQFEQKVGAGVVSVNRLETSNKGFLGTLRDLSVVAGTASMGLDKIRSVASGLAGDMVRVNAEFERLTTLMRSMSKAVDPVADAAKQVRFIRDYAKQAPYSLAALTDTFVKMKATGVDPLSGAMTSLVDGIAAFGGGEEALKRATIAITQMSGKGVIQMEELRQQLAESMPRAAEMMARGLGISMQQLIQDISTGTVSSKAALNAMFGEFERVFGGRAQTMMRTFSGQWALTKTLFQDFALNVGQTGFFDELKRQLEDFNNMLRSTYGKSLAQGIGEGLTAFVRLLRQGVDFAVRFKDEILAIGQAIAAGFAAHLVMGGLQGMFAMFTKLRTQIRAVQVEYALLNRASAVSAFMGAGRGVAAGAGMVGAFSGIARFLPLLVSGFAAFGGIIPIVVGGLALATTALINFKNNTAEAYEEFKKFGSAVGREGVARAREHLPELSKEIGWKNAAVRYWRNLGIKDDHPQMQALLAKRAELIKQYNALNADLNRADAELDETGARKYANQQSAELDKAMATKQNAYDRDRAALAEKYDKERQEAAKAGKSLVKIDEQYQDDVRRLVIRNYDDRLALLRDFIAKNEELLKSGNEADKRNAQAALTSLSKEQTDLIDRKAQAEQQKYGSVTSEKIKDENRLLEQGNRLLENMRAKIAGNKAEMAGASNEAEKLVYQLTNIRFAGATDNPAIQKLIEDIRSAQIEYEKLEEVIEGKNKLERDLENAKRAQMEQSLRLNNKNYDQLTDTQKILVKLQAGYYTGYALDAQGQLISVTSSMADRLSKITGSANQAKQALSEGVFGQNVLNRATGFKSIMVEIVKLWERFSGIVSGVDPSRALNGGNMPSALNGLGYTSGVGPMGGSLVDKIIGVESGGNPYARNSASSATGLGQFIKSTWTKFLAEMHPELLLSFTSGAYDSRTNTELSREAVGWYANKNAQFLASHGARTDDAALYLAHFLGPQGALTTLSSNMMTMASAILPEKAVQANQSILAGKTVAEVIAWAERKVGTGQSWQGSATSWSQPQRVVDTATGLPMSVDREKTVTVQSLREMDEENRAKANVNRLKEDIAELESKARKAADEIEGMGKAEALVRSRIKEGVYGDSAEDKDPTAEKYKKIIELAQKADQEEASAAKKRSQRTKVEAAQRDTESNRKRLEEEAARTRAQLDNPLGHQDSDEYLKLKLDLEKRLQAYREFYGAQSKEALGFEQDMQLQLQSLRDQEVREHALGWAKKTDEIRRGNLTADQLRQEDLRRALEAIEQELAAFRGSAEERMKLEAIAQKYRAALQKQAAAEGPLQRQMKQWGELGNNLESAMTGWIDGAGDALAKFITTGKMDFKSLVNSMVSDLTKMALKFAMSKMFSKGGPVGGADAGAGKAGKAAQGGKSLGKLFGFHSGGIIGGRPTFTRDISAGIPRFHTGGIIGRDEQLIIGQKGEGVFTPEQMRALGGAGGSSQVITIAPSVTVNASGGTPQQNNDLAAQTSKMVENTVRQLVTRELRQQMRPGNMLNR